MNPAIWMSVQLFSSSVLRDRVSGNYFKPRDFPWLLLFRFNELLVIVLYFPLYAESYKNTLVFIEKKRLVGEKFYLIIFT